MYFTYLTISILKIITHIPTVTASPLTHGLPIFLWFTMHALLPNIWYKLQIYDTNCEKKIIRHQLSILLEKLNEYTLKKRKKISLIKPTIPLLTIPFVTTFGVINENNFYKIVSLKFQLYNKKDNFE